MSDNSKIQVKYWKDFANLPEKLKNGAYSYKKLITYLIKIPDNSK